jgi:histidyl-tRNA synthetase
LPEEKLLEERMLRIIRTSFERFGFAPIETPAVERKEVLAAKGVVEKEIYALSRLAAEEGDDGSTDFALHFDLTVPAARYVAQHFGKLTFPFRRYQIQKVWRGERPQAGRFREFYQCDIDIVGNGSLDLLNDAEIPCVIHAVFREMDIGRFVIRMNNRKILTGLMENLGIERPADAMRAVDALEKVGAEKVLSSLEKDAGTTPAQAQALVEFLQKGHDLATLTTHDGGEMYRRGVAELEEVVRGLRAFGLPEDAFAVDPSIARGLDYYTGTVYETKLVDHPEVGSICSGGRYDDLASNYTKQTLPGVGISIGLTRLLSRLLDAKIVAPGSKTPARALVTVMTRDRLADYLAIAGELREAGIATELYTEPKKLGAQLKYADQKGFELAVIAGEDELGRGEVQLKNLKTGEQRNVAKADLVSAIEAG